MSEETKVATETVSEETTQETPTNTPDVGSLIAESKKYRQRSQDAEAQLAKLQSKLEEQENAKNKLLSLENQSFYTDDDGNQYMYANLSDDESEESDIEVKSELPGEDTKTSAVLGLLTKAQEEAEKIGDPKLTDQIGNTITFFTRKHVVKSTD